MSSKSACSTQQKRKSILSLRMPSFQTYGAEATRTADPELEIPRSEPRLEALALRDARVKVEVESQVEKRSSRMERLSSLLPLLTFQSTDHLVSHNVLHRKPVPPVPQSADIPAQQPLYGYRDPKSTSAGFDAASPPQQLPTQPLPSLPPRSNHGVLAEDHARSSSPPTTSKKIHKAPPPGQDQQPPPPVPPKQYSVQPAYRQDSLPRERARSNSPGPHQANRLHVRHASQSPAPRGRSPSAEPPRDRTLRLDTQRVVSTSGVVGDASIRPLSTGSPPPPHGKLRRSWLPGGHSRSGSPDMGRGQAPAAWVILPEGRADYNITPLIRGEKVPELWNETGDVYIFLGAPDGALGPSFKVPSYVLSPSQRLTSMIQADVASAGGRADRNAIGRSSLSLQDPRQQTTTPISPLAGAQGRGEANIYIPLIQPSINPDLERLAAVRNLFAFLTGQPLIGTREHSTAFSVFLQISSLLREFDFSNYDGSTFGEPAELSFRHYLDQLALADVRHSREKTIEAVILGEQMRSLELFQQGFAHAVGKYDAIIDIKSPLFRNISSSTRSRLERAHLDLLNRQANVHERLESFEFPSLFTGIAASTSTVEYRNVKFKEWRSAFGKMRSFFISYYKDLFGHWPPKARSKKNNFSEGGLNRICLKIVYSDLCALYDLLVDRNLLTTRGNNKSPVKSSNTSFSMDPRILALRRMLGEFDHSSPPVRPPIPYDVPKLPSMTAIREDYDTLPAKQQGKFDRAIQPHEFQLIMLKSRNIDTDQLKVPFLACFKEFEHREAKGLNPVDMADQRIGYWLFLYVVIQSLPMLVIDAPGLHFTEGVEYFLCEPHQGNPPWVEDAGEVRKVWYEVSGGQNIVALSADVVMFSVEAIYHRSHCWLAAQRWEAGGPGAAAGVMGPPPLPPPQHRGSTPMSPLEPPRPAFQDFGPVANSPVPLSAGASSSAGSPQLLPIRPRNASPHHHGHRASSIGLGLEPLQPPERIPGDDPRPWGSRPGSSSSQGPKFIHHGQRASSIGFGLEPLQPPDRIPGDDPRPWSRGSGSRPGSSASGQFPHHSVSKSSSVGNLHQLVQGQREPLAAPRTAGPRPGSEAMIGGSGGGGSTFDDILKGMEQDKVKKKRFGF